MAKAKNKRNSGLSDKVRNKRQSDSTKKKLNPFEVHINKEKIKVLGKKSKHDRGLPGVSRAKAIQKRKETLGTEMKLMNKTNAFIDRRIGEKDTQLSAEDRMLARFAAERVKQHSKKNIFNLADDEILTHRGQTLEQIEKFDDPRSEDEDDEDGRKFGGLGDDFVAEGHFGGGMLKTESRDGAKSHKDLIEQLIAESKKRKAEKQKEKEQTLDLTEQLDSEWKDLQPVVFKRARVEEPVPETAVEKVLDKAEKKSEDYDKMMRELKFEKRGTPSDALKSVEKLAKEEQAKLEQWERDRAMRMMPEEDKPKAAQNTVKHRSADDLDDNFELDDEKEFMLAYDKDGKPLVPENVLKDFTVPNAKPKFEDGISDTSDDDDDEGNEDSEKDEENEDDGENEKDEENDNDDENNSDGDSEESDNNKGDESINKKVKKTSKINENCVNSNDVTSEDEEDNEESDEKSTASVIQTKPKPNANHSKLESKSKQSDKKEEIESVLFQNGDQNSDESEDEESEDENDEDDDEEDAGEETDDMKDLKYSEDESDVETHEKDEEHIQEFFDLKSEEGDKLKELLHDKTPSQQSAALQKLIKSYDPGLGANNKDLLSRLFAHLLQYTNDIFTNLKEESDVIKAFLIFDKIVPHMFDLVTINKVSTKKFLAELLKEKHEKYLKRPKVMPDLDTLIFFKLVSLLYPTSDYRHPITTPSLIFMTEILTTAKFNDAFSISLGLFITALVLEYTVLSKRYVPAAVNFLRGILYLSANLGLLNPVQVVPPFRLHRNVKLLNLEVDCSKMEIDTKMAAADLVKENIDDEFKIKSFATTVLMLREFFDNYSDIQSQDCIFQPHLLFIDRVDVELYPKKVSTIVDEVVKHMKGSLESKNYVPLTKEKVKPKALRLYEPDIQEVFTGSKSSKLSREQSERARLQTKLKKEMKGALREIRRDKAYIASVKIREKIHGDNIRKEKVKQIYKDASVQQGELNKLKRMK